MKVALDFSLPAGFSLPFWGIIAALFGLVAVGTVFWSLRGVALYELSAGKKVRRWLGFVPVARDFALGCCAGKAGGILTVLSVLKTGFGFLTVIKAANAFTQTVSAADRLLTDGKTVNGTVYDPLKGIVIWLIGFGVLWLLYHIFSVVACHGVFKAVTPEKSAVLTAFCLVFPFLKTVFLFSVRNAEQKVDPNAYFEGQEAL